MGQSDKFVDDISSKDFSSAKDSLRSSMSGIIASKVDQAVKEVRDDISIGGTPADEE